MTSVNDTRITLSRAYTIILAVFPYTDTARIYNQLRTLAPIPWTCTTTYITLGEVFDLFARIVPQTEMDIFRPRLVEVLAGDRLGTFEDLERAAIKSTLRIRVPYETFPDADDEDCVYIPRICYCS
jgi:hypothetical protein